MPAIYAKPPSRPSTPSQQLSSPSPQSLKRARQLSSLRSTYSQAGRTFLLRDYAATATALVQATSSPRPIDSDAWFTALSTANELPELELHRKVDILHITFLATVHSSPPSALPAPIASLVSLSAPDLLTSLWSTALHASTPHTEILSTPDAAFLHPSLAIALTLAALKLDEPRLARAIAEAWFGSVSEEVERVIEEESARIDWSEFGLEEGMTASRVGGWKDKVDRRRQLVASWLRLLDLLVLHVLPKLGEWEAAGDFIRLQGVENGGWVPDDRVEVRYSTPLPSPSANPRCSPPSANSPPCSKPKSPPTPPVSLGSALSTSPKPTRRASGSKIVDGRKAKLAHPPSLPPTSLLPPPPPAHHRERPSPSAAHRRQSRHRQQLVSQHSGRRSRPISPVRLRPPAPPSFPRRATPFSCTSGANTRRTRSDSSASSAGCLPSRRGCGASWKLGG